jgi:large subunit ribosomal protein L22
MANGSGVKTNERPGTRAVAKYIRISPYKVREVLDLIRGEHVQRAAEILRFSERDAAFVVGKVLASAVANAENNDGIDPEELYVSACYADEGTTIKRFRPRARGRAGRIRKRTCHVTLIVSRMDPEKLARFRTKQAAEQQARRARRVAGGRGGDTGAQGGGRGGRLRRNRNAAPTNEPEVLDEVEQEQVEAVNEDVEAAVEADVVDNSPVSEESEETVSTDEEESE